MSKGKHSIDYSKGKTQVQQGFHEDSKLTNIVKRFSGQRLTTGEQLSYIDMYDAPTFQQAQNLVANVKSEFDNLPSALRGRFENNPRKMLEFAQNPENSEEAIKLGLNRPKEEKPPTALETEIAKKTLERDAIAALPAVEAANTDKVSK